MAFFPTTTRDGNPIGNPFALSGTKPNVGPGVYAVTSAFEKKGPSYAPFASSSERDSKPGEGPCRLAACGSTVGDPRPVSRSYS